MAGDEQLLRGRSILVVDDHDHLRNLLTTYLRGLGCECVAASGGHEALARLHERVFDVVILDLRMDDLDGIEVLKRSRAAHHARNYVMMSAEGTIGHAVDAIRIGAADFLVKPFELSQLLQVLQRVLGTSRPDTSGVRDPRLQWRDRYAPGLVGEHASLLDVFLVLERIANTDCTVLVLGESGTGKELVARAIHNSSNRANQPFVPVNCGAIPETLIESELFGHSRGAFSGATQSREGRFAAADGGTLFLDEIGEMSLPVQVKFLRVLQEGEYVPVGETRPRKCDVRIIAATNKNLEKMAEEGSFREDLFYRLNLIPLHLPSLRERRDDIPTLARHFLQVFNRRRNREMPGFSNAALALMSQYNWPGNVRELENTIERMSLLHPDDSVLEVDDLPPKIQQLARRGGEAEVEPPTPPSPTIPEYAPPARIDSMAATGRLDPFKFQMPAHDVEVEAGRPANAPDFAPARIRLPEEGIDLRKAVEEFEMSLIEQALERTQGNKNQAAMLLGMNRTTLVEKLRKWKRLRAEHTS